MRSASNLELPIKYTLIPRALPTGIPRNHLIRELARPVIIGPVAMLGFP